MTTINFVTTNDHKFAVAHHFFQESGLLNKFTLKQYRVETPEIQADSVEEVATSSAKWVAEKLQQAVVVADAGLSIQALKGFPGPYMKYFNQTLSTADLLAMLEKKPDRRANFIDALTYYDPAQQIAHSFVSTTPGRIASEPAQTEGSTVDMLFIPDGWDVPLADIPDDKRKAVWKTDRWQKMTDLLQSL